MDIDLDIQNYSMEEILNLFKIPINFDESDLKKAKKLVLMTHPDKSKLSPEYFLFYSKAYKILFSVYEFKNKTRKDQSTEYEVFEDSQDKAYIEKYLKQNKFSDSNFCKWFNDEFEKRTDIEKQRGYDEWLKSDEGIETTNVKLNEMNDYFKKKNRDLVLRQEVDEFISGNYTELGGKEDYSSGMFSSLYYSDLKEAHSMIPISLEYNDKKLDDYKNNRKLEDIKNVPLNEETSLKVLNSKIKMDEEDAISRAYYFAKKTQESEQSNHFFMAKMKMLK